MEGDRSPSAIRKDLEILASFIGIYCAKKHAAAEKHAVQFVGPLKAYPAPPDPLCGECGQLLLYSAAKRVACPQDPKPSCRKCPANCYRADYHERMRTVMRFSGRHYAQARWRSFWRRWLKW